MNDAPYITTDEARQLAEVLRLRPDLNTVAVTLAAEINARCNAAAREARS